MFDLYREACRELRAPEDKIEEIIAMTEKTSKKRIRPLRTALIAAAAVAMMVVGVSAANPEGVQEFFCNIASYIQVDDYRAELTTTEGERVSVVSVPEAAVEVRDGRIILTLNGEEEADITDVFTQTGKDTYEKTSKGDKLIATVEGTVDDWVIMVQVGEPEEDSPTYTFTRDENGNVTAKVDISDMDGEENIWTSVYTDDGKSVSLDEIGIK